MTTSPVVLDPVHVVLGASVPVKAVLCCLLLFSFLSWAVIGTKWIQLRRVKKEWASWPSWLALSSLYDPTLQEGAVARSLFGRLWSVCLKERIGSRGGMDRERARKGSMLERSLRKAAAEELARLEGGLGLLGTIGSTSPFVGLLGTVYGIMDAFLSMGSAQSVGLTTLAPKIAEALIATAVGLVAAIPSVMAYNFFVQRMQRVEAEVLFLVDELLSHCTWEG